MKERVIDIMGTDQQATTRFSSTPVEPPLKLDDADPRLVT